jgi:NSS family neurotransmitter:Na+ symporter
MGVSAAFLIMSFYSEVAAWVFAYIFKAASGRSFHRSRRHGAAFNSLITDPLQSLLWQWLVLALMGDLADGGLRGSKRSPSG